MWCTWCCYWPVSEQENSDAAGTRWCSPHQPTIVYDHHIHSHAYTLAAPRWLVRCGNTLGPGWIHPALRLVAAVNKRIPPLYHTTIGRNCHVTCWLSNVWHLVNFDLNPDNWLSVHRLWRILCLGIMRPAGELDFWPYNAQEVPVV